MSIDCQARHILAVNDSPEVLALLREVFEEEAYRVSTRINGETHLEEITQIAPDLVILDYSSETESTLLQQLTTDPRTQRIPIILCTGAVRKVEQIKPQLEMLGVAVVYKPFDIEHIVRIARDELGPASDQKESLPPRFD